MHLILWGLGGHRPRVPLLSHLHLIHNVSSLCGSPGTALKQQKSGSSIPTDSSSVGYGGRDRPNNLREAPAATAQRALHSFPWGWSSRDRTVHLASWGLRREPGLRSSEASADRERMAHHPATASPGSKLSPSRSWAQARPEGRGRGWGDGAAHGGRGLRGGGSGAGPRGSSLRAEAGGAAAPGPDSSGTCVWW